MHVRRERTCARVVFATHACACLWCVRMCRGSRAHTFYLLVTKGLSQKLVVSALVLKNM